MDPKPTQWSNRAEYLERRRHIILGGFAMALIEDGGVMPSHKLLQALYAVVAKDLGK
jgi:hypothetical protein